MCNDYLFEVEEANIAACIEARKKARLPEVKDVTDIDCDYECPLAKTCCPITTNVETK